MLRSVALCLAVGLALVPRQAWACHDPEGTCDRDPPGEIQATLVLDLAFLAYDSYRAYQDERPGRAYATLELVTAGITGTLAFGAALSEGSDYSPWPQMIGVASTAMAAHAAYTLIRGPRSQPAGLAVAPALGGGPGVALVGRF